MAALEPEELMDTGEDEEKLPTPADVVMMTESQSKDQVQVVLSIKWEEGFKPGHYKSELTKAFQTWVNTNKLDVVIEVEEASDSEASIKINPAPGGKAIWADLKSSVLTKLHEAKGQTLSNKNRKIVTVVSVRLPETQEPHNAPINLSSPSVPDPQHELRRSVVDSAAEEETYTCKIPVDTYLYMNHIYKENIHRIVAENGVKIAAQVTVNFEPDKENGDPRKAMSEFRNLVQTSLTQSDSLSNPLGGMAREVLQELQKDKNKVVLTPSSEEMAESEPGQSQDAISESLDMIQTTSTNTKPSVGEPTWSSYEKPQTIGMSIKDPLAYAGLDIEESVWILLNTSFNDEVAKLKAKFNVDLKESGYGKGQVNIKAVYRRSEPNKSMESHAVRALLRLYQRIGTSPLGLTKRYGVSGFNSSLKTNDYQSEGASAGAVSKGPPGYNREEPTGGTAQTSTLRSLKTNDYQSEGASAGAVSKGPPGYNREEPTGGTAQTSTLRSLKTNDYQSEGASAGAVSKGPPGYNREEPTGGTAQTSTLRSLKTNDYQSEGASAGAVSKGPPGYNREEPTGGTVAVREEDANCPICMDKFTNKTQLKCGHEFCKDCLKKAKINSGPICPVCRDVFDVVEGDQPPGTMKWNIMRSSLDGFPNCGTIVITYYIPGGTQTERHPNPGQRYHGTQRVAYLPDSDEGREVLQLLSRAFNQKLIFTVGRSRTTGLDNEVTWNDIHHKSFQSGGPEKYGYPDPDYLSRVREELKAKGIM